MHMIRHHNKPMQFVATELTFAGEQGIDHQLRNLRHPKISRTMASRIQNPIHRDERFATEDSLRWKHAASGKSTVESEGNKYRVADDIPMRQSPFINVSLQSCAAGEGNFSVKEERRLERRLQAKLPAPQLPTVGQPILAAAAFPGGFPQNEKGAPRISPEAPRTF
jgi:hypothetical protein